MRWLPVIRQAKPHPPTALQTIPITWPFAVWGLDMAGHLKGGTYKVGGQAVLGRQQWAPTPWLTERHGYDPLISLNSLDREGVRLLSPRDSQILPKPVCRCQCYRVGDTTKLKEEFDEDRVRYVVPFPVDQ